MTVPVTHKTRGGLRRINFRINDAISWTGVDDVCTSCSSTNLPFVGNESRMDLVDLVILEHRGILIEYTGLGEVRSSGIRCGNSIGGCVHSLKAVTSD